MALSINTYLKDLAYQYYISKQSQESNKIDTSFNALRTNLFNYFDGYLLNVIDFGSYTRDTILPRTYDSNSDIDTMIIFDHNKLNVTAETYRNYLLKFAEVKYPRTVKAKDFPTVVLDMHHIKLDLVPTILKKDWLNREQKHIPNSSNSWQETDPHGFNYKLSNANTQYNSIVKPIIRLLKAWNAKVAYPYSSYQLEQIIVDMNFSGDNYQSGFFYAVDNLKTDNLSILANQKVQTLKNNKSWVIEYLNRDDINKAKECLHRILPY